MRTFYFRTAALISVLLMHAIVVSIVSAQMRESGSVTDGKKLYRWYCAPCHGIKGDGKGFNAGNLDPRPANHTDIRLMSRRSDRELNEAIAGGGKAAGKSTLMPPWGYTLNTSQIRALILYLRKLCSCQGE